MTKMKIRSGNIDFVSKSSILSIVSLFLVMASILFISTEGLNYGIDFAGGMEAQVRFETHPVEIGKVRLFAQETQKLEGVVVQAIGKEKGREYLLRFPVVEDEQGKVQTDNLKANFLKHFADAGPKIQKMHMVGPQVGSDLRRKGALAVFYSLLVILIYVAMRFDYKYAPGAVLCLFHDVVITLSLLLLLGKEMNLPILAALLMLIGYSLNDTIVMYDRIRENIRSLPKKDMPFLINKSINDMLSRTIITSVTTLLSVLALCLLARGVIFDIALCLGVGVLVGTYSSICVAAPVLLWMDRLFKKG